MLVHVLKSYDDACKGFLGAGMGTDLAKQFALQAANNEKLTLRQVIETMFPTNANTIGDRRAKPSDKACSSDPPGSPILLIS